jgi:hypothetical protein
LLKVLRVRRKNGCEKLKGYSLILENFVGFALEGWHESNFGNKKPIKVKSEHEKQGNHPCLQQVKWS